jgi:hypothetical protein
MHAVDAVHVRNLPVESILPCGLRVLVAHDGSLPVAAVVLSVEAGTTDDPPDQPGLVHALAYQLLMGTADVKPGGALSRTNDRGGLATMAVGRAQTRFESLVPVLGLEDAIDMEARRLIRPTVSAPTWKRAVSYARKDQRPRPPVPREAIAAAWDEDGLAHDGRVAPKPLQELVLGAVSAQLARLFTLPRATLVVVSPRPPADVLEHIAARFSELPAMPRAARSASPPRFGQQRSLTVPRQKGDVLTWAIPGEPTARAWAQVVCASLNRQKRSPDEPRTARARCQISDDPRRPIMIVRANGGDPSALIQRRLDRIAAGEMTRVWSAQTTRTKETLSFNLHTPLGLARGLALATDAGGAAHAPRTFALEDRTGVATLDPEAALPDSFAALLSTAESVVMIPDAPAKTEAVGAKPAAQTNAPEPAGAHPDEAPSSSSAPQATEGTR